MSKSLSNSAWRPLKFNHGFGRYLGFSVSEIFALFGVIRGQKKSGAAAPHSKTFVSSVVKLLRRERGDPPSPGQRRGCQIRHYFGASEFTIFSKHGLPRNGSHSGIRFIRE
jgi:hypothetical protein